MSARARVAGALAVFVALAALDLFWLSTPLGGHGLAVLAKIQGSPVRARYGAAIVVYLALATVHSFAESYREAAVLGAAVYAVYDFTNLALLNEYSAGFTALDVVWGATAFAAAFGVKSLALRVLA
jgi:uncharacterized membrane protein